VFCPQTIPPTPEPSPDNARVAEMNGFSLHTGMAARAPQTLPGPIGLDQGSCVGSRVGYGVEIRQ